MPSDIEFYLDSNIIVAYYFEDDDANQHERVLDCLDKISSSKDISLIASTWTMIEADNSITKRIRKKVTEKIIKDGKIADFERKKAKKFIAHLWNDPKLGDVKFKIQRFSKDTEDENFLDVEDFLDLVDDVASLGNLRDALHCVCMNHFDIKKILTFNDKDFKIFEMAMGDIKAVNPDDIDNYIGGLPTTKAKEIERRESDSGCDIERHTAKDYGY